MTADPPTRLAAIKARPDAATTDDVIFLLDQVADLLLAVLDDHCPRCDTMMTCPACRWPERSRQR